MARKLYRYKCDCGRMGAVRGLFTAEEDAVRKAIGQRVYFGEILGKHSEIQGVLEEKELSVVTEDADFIARFDAYNCASGYNPLDYLEDGDA